MRWPRWLRSSGGERVDMLDHELETANEFAAMQILQSELFDRQLSEAVKQRIRQRGLLWACEEGSEQVLRFVLERGATPNARDVRRVGRTLLYVASARGQTEIVRLLLESQVDVNAANKDRETPLLLACTKGYTDIVRLLLEARADVNLADKDGVTPLLSTCTNHHIEIVRLLLEGRANVNLVNKDGETALLLACLHDDTEIGKLLIEAGADVRMASKKGRTPLHCAQSPTIARCLLGAGADPTALDKHGRHSFHAACRYLRYRVARVLLASSNVLNTPDRYGYHPIHLVLFRVVEIGCVQEGLRTLQLLVEYGSGWDSTCDKITQEDVIVPFSRGWDPNGWRRASNWKQQGHAVRFCFAQWTLQQQEALPLTDVPTEQVRNGANAAKIYIQEFVRSRNVVLRSKICVVGPSNWGKTSLVKSLTTEVPSLIHPDDRTIGIDHFRFAFEEQLEGRTGTTKYEVTFWDFAGQEAYQSAHSLFYSARTLYVVCIDLESYMIARMQAELMTDTESEAGRWMNEFVDTRILRWIRVICACQPDAEFVFVATKKDCVADANLEGDDALLTDLQKRMENVAVIIREMRREIEKSRRATERRSKLWRSPDPGPPPITHLGDPRLAGISKKPSVRVIVTSCVRSESVDAFKMEIQEVIKNSGRGFPMPEKFSIVLDALLQLRTNAMASATDQRIATTFIAVEDLIQTLVRMDMNSSGLQRQRKRAVHLNELTCCTILQTLRDLGDVLWYDKMDDELLKNTIIVDPMIMLDLVREIFDHNHTDEVMTHHTLKGLKHWRHLEGTDSMLSMKRVLQNFGLVYPTTGEMAANSDLIVPAYWKTNTSAFWMFGGGDLRFGRGVHREDVAIRVHFEYQFVNNYPDTLFDRVVVASYSPFYTRDIGPDWIMYKEDDAIACRLMVGRDHQTHHPMLHLEALQGHSASDREVEQLWEIFTLLAESLEVVTRDYPGVVICRYVRKDTAEDVEQTRYTLETLQKFKLIRASRKWLPPKSAWKTYVKSWETTRMIATQRPQQAEA